MQLRLKLVAWILAIALPLDTAAEPAADTTAPAPKWTVLAPVAAVMPGVLVHGAGHWAMGEHRTASKLFLAQGVGLAAVLAGGIPLVATGASNEVSWIGIPLLVSGTGMLWISWLADVYGSVRGSRIAGTPRLILPNLEVTAGYAFISDPQFNYNHLTTLAADVRYGQGRLSPSLWWAPGQSNWRLRADAAWRITGPDTVETPARSGSFVDIAGRATYHSYSSDAFAVTSAEVFGDGRLDLETIGQTLRGAFASLTLGYGMEHIAYSRADNDWISRLVTRFGIGVHLGDGRGQAELFYDHRRDSYEGGLVAGRGFLGHFGLEAFYYLTQTWGITARATTGSANIVHLGARWAVGEAQ